LYRGMGWKNPDVLNAFATQAVVRVRSWWFKRHQ
jgi:hypothetical protein